MYLVNPNYGEVIKYQMNRHFKNTLFKIKIKIGRYVKLSEMANGNAKRCMRLDVSQEYTGI